MLAQERLDLEPKELGFGRPVGGYDSMARDAHTGHTCHTFDNERLGGDDIGICRTLGAFQYKPCVHHRKQAQFEGVVGLAE